MSVFNPKNNFSNSSRYRPEINGLRAFAVTTVILNHLNKEILPGGFLGVDIFFVISGFVITSSLYQKPSKNFKDFICGFYERRIKRLIPALSFFVLITSITICLVNPQPQSILRTGLTSLFGLSNLYLLKNSTDYFAQTSELNVFTHTWSLGVEEQFYIIFPFLIWLSGFGRQTKNGERNLFISVSSISCASLISFLYLNETNQKAAYFLMQARFWEMAAGCLVFLILQKKSPLKKFLGKLPPLLMILIILVVMYIPLSWTAVSTVLVVVLTSILLISLNKKSVLALKILTNPTIVYIGQISYSLYLWHWGVIAISRWTIGIHWWSIPFQVMIILLLAIISFLYIETPFRNRNLINKGKGNLFIGIGLMITLSGILIALDKPFRGILFSGKKDKDPSNELLKRPLDFSGEVTGRLAKNCHSSNKKESDALKDSNKITPEFLANCLSKKSNKPLVAISGDSHSTVIFPISEVIASENKYDVFSHGRAACAFPPQGETSRKNCFEVQSSFAQNIEQEIKSRLPGSIVISSSYLSSHFGYDGAHRWQIAKYSDGSRKSVDKNLKEFVDSSKKFAGRLKDEKASLIIIAPLPQHPGFTPEICSQQWFRPSPPSICEKTDKLFLLRQRKHIIKAINELANQVSNVYIFDPFDNFCDLKYCYAKKNNKILYIDDNHLSERGVSMITEDLMSLIESIRKHKK